MNLRELKYVLIGEDRLSNKLRGVSQAGSEASNSLRNTSSRLAQFKKSANYAAKEIPGLSQGISLMTNPILLGAAAFTALGSGIRSAMNESKQFNTTLRNLGNLNLDKSVKDLSRLKTLVRQTALEGGFDQNKTATGYFDVQSITGKYGGDASKIVSKQGQFAELMGADFNEWIAGTAKAMTNYGFGAEKLDEFNKAAYATFKTGYITFDQLAKVQSAYAGAASSAGQSFASANKMLSVFTIKTKSVDEAATLTKSLFNDLTKKTTQQALKSVGIDLFDMSDKVKGADVLMIELNNKFKELGGNDRKIIELKNQFGGSEGLSQFVQAATEQSGQLVRTLNDFDASELGMNKALALAKKDINYINQQLENRTKVLMAQMGDEFNKAKMPYVEIMNDLLMGHNIRAQGVDKYSEERGASHAVNSYQYIATGAREMNKEQWSEAMKKLRDEMLVAKEGLDKYKSYENSSVLFNGENKVKSWFYRGYASTLAEIFTAAKEERAKGLITKTPPRTDSEGTSDDTFKNGLNSVSGGGNQVRNITVNITKLIESQNINTTNLTEGSMQVQQKVEEALIRAIAGTEQMMAS